MEKGGALHLNKLESPSHKNALCQVWLKLAEWFWRKKNFLICQCISQFRNNRRLEKGRTLHLNKLESLSPKNAVCKVWLKLAKWF